MNVEDIRRDFLLYDYDIRNYINLSDTEKRTVWECRNSEDVRKWMTSSGLISWEDHLSFVERLGKIDNKFYWGVFSDRGFLAGISLVDYHDGSGNPGIFLNPDLFGSGAGLSLTILTVDLMLHVIKLDEIHSLVHKENSSALRVNLFLGYNTHSYDEKFDRISMTREEWEQNRLSKIKLIRHY